MIKTETKTSKTYAQKFSRTRRDFGTFLIEK